MARQSMAFISTEDALKIEAKTTRLLEVILGLDPPPWNDTLRFGFKHDVGGGIRIVLVIKPRKDYRLLVEMSEIIGMKPMDQFEMLMCRVAQLLLAAGKIKSVEFDDHPEVVKEECMVLLTPTAIHQP